VNVGRGSERQKRWETVVTEPGRKLYEALTSVDGVDLAEPRFDRRRPSGLDRFLVHAGGVGVADVLLVGRPASVVERRVLENVADDSGVAIRELVQPAVARSVGRKGVGGEPVTACELIEIRAGIHAAIEMRRAEPARRLRLGVERR
jgi:hypothetical protein